MLDSFKLSNRSKHIDIFPQNTCPALTAHKYLCVYIYIYISQCFCKIKYVDRQQFWFCAYLTKEIQITLSSCITLRQVKYPMFPSCQHFPRVFLSVIFPFLTVRKFLCIKSNSSLEI